MIGDSVHGANLIDIVYGDQLPVVADASEDFIEASNMHREAMGWEAPGVRMLESVPEMQAVVARAGRDYASRPAIDLPAAAPIEATLTSVLQHRRSAPQIGDKQLSQQQLATLLRTVWEPVGQTGAIYGSSPRRPSPSAGALQPLDLWVVVRDVEDLEPGLYYVQMNHTGEAKVVRIAPVDREAFAVACFQEELVNEAAVSIVITAMPWRSRFKYGHRATRFALIEAGHVAQNVQLVATAMGLGSRPLGGFCDDEVNELLGLDSVNEFALYVLPVGTQ